MSGLTRELVLEAVDPLQTSVDLVLHGPLALEQRGCPGRRVVRQRELLLLHP